MKKKLIYATGIFWGTVQCVHLALDTPQKVDFTNKRIMMIEKYITEKLSEKALLEQKVLITKQTSKDVGALALLQTKLTAINIDITDLQHSITVAKNSVKSLLAQP